MEIYCNLCDDSISIDGRDVKCPNDIMDQAPGWEQDDEGNWICPNHSMKSYRFTSEYIVEARSMDEAKEIFSNNSINFAADAECEEVEE